MGKLTSLREAVAAIGDRSVLALGGNTIHRAPCAAVHELIRQGKRGLTVVKTAGAYDVDVLCGAGCVDKVLAAYVGFENYGLAPRFRKSVEQGRSFLLEHT